MSVVQQPQAESRSSLREWLLDLFSGEPENRTELREMLHTAAQRNLMDDEALNISLGALQIADMQARDIMVPRSQLVCLEAGKPFDELLQVIVESRHSRFPVIADDPDDIRGILHAKDLLPMLRNASPHPSRADFDLKDCIRPAHVIPESKRLNVLLREFRETRNHMAVVVDEYGHVSGVATIEDVLEQIVGEIEDEHDVDEDSLISRLDDGACNVKATTPIEEFNAYFGVDLAENGFDTVGGIVLNAFGRMPDRGEAVAIGGLNFEVLSTDSRRLRLLRVSPRVLT